MTSIHKILRKYFIMGSQNCSMPPGEILKEAIAGGITAFQFREKGLGSLSGEAKLELGKELRNICKENQIPFFVNDDIELAESLQADGIHVGQDDLDVEEIRLRYPDFILGLSVSNSAEVNASPLHLVDYIGAGPIFATTTKDDAKQAVGTDWIASLRKDFPELPIVGIGGINTENANKVIKAGADGVAVISVITSAKDIKKTVKSL
ncbi:thiamine phosphate synthase [Virgibacillus halodenitrificans]|uniref:Thiamine-phosphate synthase n=1 Tax=Virgibacillus halodenitrificans TaxID=1482 RepID=A0ABR7VM66_VIRHA|nr:thiamine phosphate synthase [Virgibacillus halodenitrificans]MBD1223004.1 thiamine phosphate synthase [Virgibacillus halodenitrificans]MCG1027443.1 thiamine phosphate synthase [Virgibacillus halodenitrificans]